MTEQAAAPAVYGQSVPGKGLGIAGLILAFLAPPLGLLLSIIAKVQSSKAGFKNGPAKAGIILGIIFIVLGIGIAIAIGASVAAACNNPDSGVTCTSHVSG